MKRYIVRWEMIYEDAQNEFDAVAQAYSHLCELALDPSTGANYVVVLDADNPTSSTASIAIDDALMVHEMIEELQ